MKGQPFVVMVNNLNLDESWGVLRTGTILFRQTCHSRNEYCIATEGKEGPIRVAKSTWQLHLQQKKIVPGTGKV